MDVTRTRAKNICMLVEQAGGPTAFGELIERDQVQVSQWTSLTRPKAVGGRLARYIEERTGHEPGWLDRPQWGNVEAPAPSCGVRLDGTKLHVAHDLLRRIFEGYGGSYEYMRDSDLLAEAYDLDAWDAVSRTIALTAKVAQRAKRKGAASSEKAKVDLDSGKSATKR